MQQVQKTIRQLMRSFKKARNDLTFVHDIKALNSSYEIDIESAKFQADVARTKQSLIRQKTIIKRGTDLIVGKIDDALNRLEHF